MENTLFINKYQPLYFNDFEIEPEIVEILQTLIAMNSLNIMFVWKYGFWKDFPLECFNSRIL